MEMSDLTIRKFVRRMISGAGLRLIEDPIVDS